MIYFLSWGWSCSMKQVWCFVLIPSTQRTTSWLRSSWAWCPPHWAETWLPGCFLCDIIKAYPWQQKPKVVPFLFHAPLWCGQAKKNHTWSTAGNLKHGDKYLYFVGESRFSKRLGQFSQSHMASEWRGGESHAGWQWSPCAFSIHFSTCDARHVA